jgi:hypothetical protein
VDFSTGFNDGFRSSIFLAYDPNYVPTDSTAYNFGRPVGDVAAGIMGIGEIVGGSGLGGSGVAACGSGVLCPAGAPAIAGGLVLAGHGYETLQTASEAFGKDLTNLFAQENEGIDSSYNQDRNFSDDFSGVEIVDHRGNPLGEFDGIDMSQKAFIENKSATGLETLNPRTNLPAQTPEDWAKKQIFDKTQIRIKNLENAIETRKTPGGSDSIPVIEQIRDFKKLHFRIDSDAPSVVKAVEAELENLKKASPDWEFTAQFGK